MSVLDNAVWHALTGPHATLAERTPRAACYRADVSIFTAVADEPGADAWDDLRQLVGAGGMAFLTRRELTVPEGWEVLFRQPCRQMVLPDEALRGEVRTDAEATITPLDASDVPDMLALVARTRPGPFVERTIELGTYLGIRENGHLVAMAGERLHPPGHVEISAVCTDDSHRGRGLASHLVRALVRGIRGRGETPFLHLTLENEPAHRIYSALGFETRARPDVVAVRAPV